MADNINVAEATAGTLRPMAAKDIGSGIMAQRVLPVFGSTGTDTTTTNPFPVESDTRYAYVYQTGNIANANATLMFDMFNATGSGLVIKLFDLRISQLQTAVSGIGLTFTITRTSTVGTGGTVLTAQKYNTVAGSLPAQITARTKATGGATTAADYFLHNASSEELSPYQAAGSHGNILATPIYLNANEGLKVTETLGSAVGQSNIIATFNVI